MSRLAIGLEPLVTWLHRGYVKGYREKVRLNVWLHGYIVFLVYNR